MKRHREEEAQRRKENGYMTHGIAGIDLVAA